MRPISKDINEKANSLSKEKVLIEKAKQRVLNLFNRYHDSRLVYHNFNRANRVSLKAKELGQLMGLADPQTIAPQIAAYFLFTGALRSHDSLQQTIKHVRDFTEEAGIGEKLSHEIEFTLQEILNLEKSPQSVSGQLLADAIHAVNYCEDYDNDRPLLRLEKELLSNKNLSAVEWAVQEFQALMSVKFYTAAGKVEYEPDLGLIIARTKQRIAKGSQNLPLDDEGNPVARPFHGLDKKMPISAQQTFFRTNYRNHINLSAIADNKANIMISVNAILISVVISIVSYRDIPRTDPMVLLPVIIFLVTGLSSLIFAVLSIRPKVNSIHSADPDELKKNLVFFGNFINLNLETYERMLDEVLRDGELLYGNMARDLYGLGKVLDKKYRYLTIAYNIFMVGFVATVISFLIAIFV